MSNSLMTSSTLGGMGIPTQRAADSDPLGQLLDYARDHSVALAELRGAMATVTAGHADHEARMRVVEMALNTLRAQLGVWRALAGVGAGGLVAMVFERLAG